MCKKTLISLTAHKAEFLLNNLKNFGYVDLSVSSDDFDEFSIRVKYSPEDSIKFYALLNHLYNMYEEDDMIWRKKQNNIRR